MLQEEEKQLGPVVNDIVTEYQSPQLQVERRVQSDKKGK